MVLNDKTLLKSKEEAQNLINDWKCQKIGSRPSIDEFEKFPCVIAYYIDEDDYSMSCWAYMSYAIIYPDDFED